MGKRGRRSLSEDGRVLAQRKRGMTSHEDEPRMNLEIQDQKRS